MSDNDRFAPPGQRDDPPEWRPLVSPAPGDQPATPFAEPYGRQSDAGPGDEAPSVPQTAPKNRRRWPWFAALALVVGGAGGYLGATVEDALDDEPVPTASSPDPGRVDPAPLPGDNDDVAKVADTLLPSTVQISSEAGGVANAATGSGFVLDKSHVVTNNHVVADAASDNGPISVINTDGVRHDATVVGSSRVYDLAVLDVEGGDLQPAALGTSQDLQVGESVVAIGSPLGLSSSVTVGIVSALHRPVSTGDSENSASYIDAVQTDAAINPGNSGGPLVNLGGQVIGVNSAIATAGDGSAGSIGVGFAIPIDQAKRTAEQILDDGQATYPVVGAEVDTRPSTTGARISAVTDGSPAEKAGLREGDRVTAVAGTRVADGVSLIVAIRTHEPGDRVDFDVERGGRERTVTVTLGAETEN